jgi:hypothetical protein
VIAPLDDAQDIVPQILVRDIPGFTPRCLSSADTQPLSLADGMEHQSLVYADDVIIQRPDFPRPSRQVALQEIPEFAFPDETNSGAVLLPNSETPLAQPVSTAVFSR